ncbi:MAG TPA: CHC2 zinc finger domain-containing protein, partial [Tepidisphaeraceae bacterium]
MSATWVDFRELRERLDFLAVLKHYGVELKLRNGNRSQHQGFCPLPTHQGKQRSPSFSANLIRKCFQCFGCQASGNVLDFAVRMEGHDPGDREAVRRVALALQERFLGTSSERPPRNADSKPKAEPEASTRTQDSGEGRAQKKPSEGSARPVIVNAPLDFQLRGLDPNHPYLKGRGFTKETIGYYGLGYCARGLMQSRIVIPLHDPLGRLIGYAGRVVDDQAITDDNPRYRFPSAREREGKTYEFHKSEFLYRGFEVKSPVSQLVIVEGFASVWWFRECGLDIEVVALMGASCSETQSKLIVESLDPDGTAWVMPDAG